MIFVEAERVDEAVKAANVTAGARPSMSPEGVQAANRPRAPVEARDSRVVLGEAPSAARSAAVLQAPFLRAAAAAQGQLPPVTTSAAPPVAAGQAAVEAQEPLAPAPPRFSGTPVSLDFQGADLRAVLRTFADISSLNVVIDPSIQGTVDVCPPRRAVGSGARHHSPGQPSRLLRRWDDRANRSPHRPGR